ncbi:hypothetical protein COHA_004432 [Chlorella ohadii]|uniref:CBM20 domain-containing protein n=1 Tax=Chlorella ohadii TaxID=2649997 RepID=A0AAD5DX33_9CHLO|nr:hypothetical protein COHA_004432 [Chlorella ohadii]
MPRARAIGEAIAALQIAASQASDQSDVELSAAQAELERLRHLVDSFQQAFHQAMFGGMGPQPARRAALCFSNADGNVSVSFRLPYRCKYGQKLCLIGSNDVLGSWHVDRAVAMNWTEGDVWTVELQLPANGNGVQLEYKYVVRSERDKSAVRWKEGNNCYLAVPTQGRLKVHDTWDDSMREVEVSRRLRQ